MKTVMGMGMNRTGIGTSPIDAKASVEGAEQGVPLGQGDGAELAAVRGQYIRDAEPLGSVPPPTTVKGAAKSAGKMLTGKNPAVFIDKLSQRLAFERTGTRLYDALLAKLDAVAAPEAISIADVRRIHDEERSHMDVVWRAIVRLGADPTVQTPSADIDGVASMGLLQILTDPRTSVTQSLHAIHIAELADNDGWAMLIELAGEMGQDEMVTEFQRALRHEHEHLALVRGWMAKATISLARVAATPP
jgi:rubrerythrin